MCFNTLPIEFDDEGNPYLADDADEVEDRGNHDHDHEHEHAADTGEALALDADPETAYAEIVADVPESVRAELADGDTDTESGRDDQREPARGD